MDGMKRLERLQEECKKIERKIEIAEEHGVDEVILDGNTVSIDLINGRLEELKKEIGKAAIAEARKEIKDAKEEAERIKLCKGPKIPAGPGDMNGDAPPDPTPPTPPTPNGGNGNGNGNGDDHKEKCCCCCCPPEKEKKPEPACVYTKSDTTVWAWDRRSWAWAEYSNGSPVVKIDFLKGGILAVTEKGAAIFDCGLGEWLPELTTTQTLNDGEGKPDYDK